MSAMTMPPAQPFHRKPVPSYTRPTHHQVPQQYPPHYGDSPDHLNQPRTATLSSTVSGIPLNASPASNGSPYMPPSHQMYPQGSRRTLSNGTSSTSSTNTNPPLHTVPTNSGYGMPPRRSTSSRSTSSASSTSYVALMRKQKATVWCDRAQHEDPRILAAQRAAKMRAAMEVAGGHNHALAAARANAANSGVVNGVRSKIRHHGAPKASTYNAGNLHGAGVPLRLSAMEVDDGDSDEDPSSQSTKYHARNGSRSSLVKSTNNFAHSQRGHSNGSTPPAQGPGETIMSDLMEEETPVPNRYGTEGNDYFGQSGSQGNSDGSGGSARREESFGAVGILPQSKPKPDLDLKKSEELKRRGSVDDRTMTMGGGRLFVANPDLSD